MSLFDDIFKLLKLIHQCFVFLNIFFIRKPWYHLGHWHYIVWRSCILDSLNIQESSLVDLQDLLELLLSWTFSPLWLAQFHNIWYWRGPDKLKLRVFSCINLFQCYLLPFDGFLQAETLQFPYVFHCEIIAAPFLEHLILDLLSLLLVFFTYTRTSMLVYMFRLTILPMMMMMIMIVTCRFLIWSLMLLTLRGSLRTSFVLMLIL